MRYDTAGVSGTVDEGLEFPPIGRSAGATASGMAGGPKSLADADQTFWGAVVLNATNGSELLYGTFLAPEYGVTSDHERTAQDLAVGGYKRVWKYRTPTGGTASARVVVNQTNFLFNNPNFLVSNEVLFSGALESTSLPTGVSDARGDGRITNVSPLNQFPQKLFLPADTILDRKMAAGSVAGGPFKLLKPLSTVYDFDSKVPSDHLPLTSFQQKSLTDLHGSFGATRTAVQARNALASLPNDTAINSFALGLS